MYQKALECYEKRDFVNADSLVRQSIECCENNYQSLLLFAKVQLFQGQFKASSVLFNKLLKKNPGNFDLRCCLIKSLILCERYDEATEEIEKALKININDWRLFYYKSVIAAKTDNVSERLFYLNKASSSLEQSSGIYYDLYYVWNELGIESKANENLIKYNSLTGGSNEK